ncbi:zinc ribbon domain-containing protein [Streptomyces sp. NPDC059456]|uniref:zinc ribbon domain-containing protein n=1 Tax=Streptomyces sp. NPDC059456 TaxID=3346838 RepID=UPI00368D8ABC
MSAFSSEKVVGVTASDLAPVASDLIAHFKERGYETTGTTGADGVGHEVSITKGGMFKKALGLRTALKIEILPDPGGTLVRAGVGIFGKQALPFAIAMLVTWPVLLTQIWGLVNQAGLDDEAIKVAELSLNRLARLGGRPGAAAVQSPGGTRSFCHQCGHERDDSARFCTKCGAPSADQRVAT